MERHRVRRATLKNGAHTGARLVGLCASLALAGCSGGGGAGSLAKISAGGGIAGSAGGSVAPASGALTVRVNLPSVASLPLFTKRARTDAARIRTGSTRRPLSITLGSVRFNGTLYPGYAGGAPVGTTLLQNTSSLPSSVTLGFNSVPAGNNEWVYVDVIGYDSPNGQGSSYDLGQLAGFASVGSPPALASIDTNSTLRLQVALSAMRAGEISTYDLQNTSALDANIGGFITGIAPVAGIGLYSNAQLDSFVTGLYPIFNRTLVVSGSILTPSYASVVYDYRNPAELNFVNNVNATYYALESPDNPATPPDSSAPIVYGNPFLGNEGDQTSSQTPPAGQQTGAFHQANAVLVAAPTGTITLQHVYGGNVIVGMSAQTGAAVTSAPPYYGGFIGLGGRPQGNTANASVPISNTTVNMAFVDPQWANMGNNLEFVSPAQTGFVEHCAGDTCPELSEVYVTGTSSTEVTVSVNAWNPWALTGSGEQICTGIECFPLSNGMQYTSESPFYDSGEDLAYYNWKPDGGAVTSVTSAVLSYSIAYSGGLSGYIGTTTPAWFFPGMLMGLESSAPAGTIFYFTLYCPTGTFSNSGVWTGSYAEIVMSSITSTVHCGATQIGFTLPAGSATSGTISLAYFGYESTLSESPEVIKRGGP
jgi:hypothetical protein